ncbi:MAG: hypothetical protein ACYCO9_01025 [Streptosporangiaceae bacterium]
MISATVTGPNLVITVTGADAWQLAMRPRWHLDLPLQQVSGATAEPHWSYGRRHVNTRRDGLLVCARFRGPTLRITAREPYQRIVLSVPDPERTASEIQQAIAGR